ncbi:MAG: acyltransferase family protein, partial [Thermoleophilia bacterium]
NWYQVVADVSYFEQFARPSVFLHLWSLAVEEQFYLIWPPVLALLIMRIGPRRVFHVVVAGIVASTVLAWVLFEPFVDPSRIYYGTDTRAGGLLVGVALAFLWPASRLGRAGESANRPLLDALGVSALVALLAIMAWMGEFDSSLYQGGFLLVAVVTAVVLAVVAHPRSLLGKGFAWAPLVWLGKRSYSIYLWHWPVLMLSRGDQDVPFDGPALVALQLALTVGLASASYRFVEEPFRKHGFAGIRAWLRTPGRDGRRRRTAAAATGLATVIVALFVAFLPAQTPTIEGIPPASAAITPGTPRPDLSRTPGPTAGGPARDGDPAKPARKPVRGPVLAVGDSVMVGAAPALRGVLGPRVQIDASVARQFDVAASATIADLKLVKPKIVVLHLGTNGYVPFEGLEALLDDLEPLPVVLVTVRVDKPWEGSVNDALAYAAERRKNVFLADWHAATDGRGDLLVDGVHANTEGQRLYAQTIMAALRRAVNAPAS